MSSDLDGEWLEALEVEAPADDKPADDKPVDDKPVDDKPADDKDTKDDAKDDTAGDDADAGDDAGADDGGKADEDEKPKDDPKEEPDEKATTKEAIKEALQEIDDAKVSRSDRVDSLKKEVLETLYPEGLDRQLRDSDGDPITGIDDLTQLINPRTGELFTDEEAGSWLLSAQQKLNKDIETVENFIEQVAEVNTNITEGAERVAAKYGAILSADDKLRESLIAAYDKTLVKDPKTGVTISAPLTPEEFFDPILGPRMTDKIAAEQAAAAQAKADAEKAAKDGQSDRGDLKPSGKSDNLDPEDKEWATAIKEYEEGK
jgi:hypothetical protein